MQEIDRFEERELKLSQLKLIVIVVLMISLGMVAYTITWFVNYENKYGFFHKTIATVIEHKEIEGDNYDVLSYVVDGNKFIITSPYISKNKIGDKITVFYDENNPLGVIYSKDAKLYGLPIVSGIFFICSVALLVIYILFKISLTRERKLVDMLMLEEIKNQNVSNDDTRKSDIKSKGSKLPKKSNTKNKTNKKKKNN